MDTVTIRGIEYRKASSVAKKLDYTPDYVGQLCRTKKVKAKLVGRTWYVNLDSILEYKKSRYNDQKETPNKASVGSIKKAKKSTVRSSEKTTVSKKKISGNKVKISLYEELPKTRIDVEPHVKAKTLKVYSTNDSYPNRDSDLLKRKPSNISYKKDDSALLPKINKTKRKETESKPHVIHLSLLKTNLDEKTGQRKNDSFEEESVVVPIKSTKKLTTLTSAGLPTVYMKGKISVSSAEKKFEVADENKSVNTKKQQSEKKKRKEVIERVISLEEEKFLQSQNSFKRQGDEDLPNDFEDEKITYEKSRKPSKNLSIVNLDTEEEEDEEENFDLKSLERAYKNKLAKENAEFVSVDVSTLKPRSIQVAQQVQSKILILKTVSWSLILVLFLVLFLSIFLEATGSDVGFSFSVPQF